MKNFSDNWLETITWLKFLRKSKSQDINVEKNNKGGSNQNERKKV